MAPNFEFTGLEQQMRQTENLSLLQGINRSKPNRLDDIFQESWLW